MATGKYEKRFAQQQRAASVTLFAGGNCDRTIAERFQFGAHQIGGSGRGFHFGALMTDLFVVLLYHKKTEHLLHYSVIFYFLYTFKALQIASLK